ncbi:MAG TPA: M28 family peptidase [Steroidobacteraceae bacterium]|nr:M28 family peptidase [Steroidobacteraceae bacterium]
MRYALILLLSLAALPAAASAVPPPLLPERAVAALTDEVSGETAKRNLEGLARLHRQRGSAGFNSAAELVAERARAYGLSGVEILKFPADGKIFYGTQRSRPGWDAREGDLFEVKDGGPLLMASYAAEPVVLAEDSESADVTAELVDVGEGAKEADYAGKNVAGKIVLVGAQPGEVQDLAVGKLSAAGIVSYAQNQPTAWSGADDRLIRWGHLETFTEHPTFAFMVSLRTARALRERLRRGEIIRLHAQVDAGQHPSAYEVVTAVIPGADPRYAKREIAFSCHLDHQRPGANDNASGCVTILEAARTLQKLIGLGRLERPRRTLRFIWPPEVEGTEALLNARPEFAERIQAVVHMDMVGGGPETKAVFHITRGPLSLPSFVHDVAWAFAAWANEQSYRFAATGVADHPLAAPEGGSEPLRAEYSAYTMGSDHDVYQDSSFAIPSIYMNDWPDRYIHTNFDTAANIDPTKLKRAAFIGAASGYYLANFSAADAAAASRAVDGGKLLRAGSFAARGTPREVSERYERAVHDSIAAFAAEPARRVDGREAAAGSAASAAPRAVAAGSAGAGGASSGGARRAGGPASAAVVYRRARAPRGPLMVFGYDYLADHLKGTGLERPKLEEYEGAWAGGEEYCYEALNLADGKRSARLIADELAAELGPVPPELVFEYLRALKSAGVLE